MAFTESGQANTFRLNVIQEVRGSKPPRLHHPSPAAKRIAKKQSITFTPRSPRSGQSGLRCVTVRRSKATKAPLRTTHKTGHLTRPLARSSDAWKESLAAPLSPRPALSERWCQRSFAEPEEACITGERIGAPEPPVGRERRVGGSGPGAAGQGGRGFKAEPLVVSAPG